LSRTRSTMSLKRKVIGMPKALSQTHTLLVNVDYLM